MLDELLLKTRTAHALGWQNVARVAGYRFGLRLGLNPVQKLKQDLPGPPYFDMPGEVPGIAPTEARQCVEFRCFGWKPIALTEAPPHWHRNVLTGVEVPDAEGPWWDIGDFSRAIGDIKAVWEPSRWDWLIQLAQCAAQGEAQCLDRLNHWLGDWVHHNPAYRGPNWKCGQEAAIRVMHLALAAVLLDQYRCPSREVAALVKAHLRRIEPTIQYAMAQDNNHGTSEAAALFIGGSWLSRLSADRESVRWSRRGRRLLEARVHRLVEEDGSFSQYSVNYHRLLLDTLSVAELWRRKLDLAPFSRRFVGKAAAAALWLRAFVQEEGDVPNMGANDGARLLPLTDTDYRDYRPSVQLACALFPGKRAYPGEGSWNGPLRWLGVEIPTAGFPPESTRLFNDGGYAVLRCPPAVAYLRYPRFRFRPDQADALHLDLWVGGKNLLRDGGSYSYSAEARWLDYFGGTAGHNTIQFDGRQQMPRLGRFLFGDWLKVDRPALLQQTEGGAICTVGYTDSRGATHRRQVTLCAEGLRVDDQVSGFREKAVLRWRLAPDVWRLDGHSVTNGTHVVSVTADMPIRRFELTEGWESRYYLHKSRTPVLEVEIGQPGALTSRIAWGK